MKIIIVILAVFVALHIVVYSDAFGAESYAFNDIAKDRYVKHSFGYRPGIGNFMGFKDGKGRVHWIILIKVVDNTSLSTVSEIRYRMATKDEAKLFTLKGE